MLVLRYLFRRLLLCPSMWRREASALRSREAAARLACSIGAARFRLTAWPQSRNLYVVHTCAAQVVTAPARMEAPLHRLLPMVASRANRPMACEESKVVANPVEE